MFNIIFTMVPIIVVIIFITTFAIIISPKLRAKMLSKQIKGMSDMIYDSKDDLRDISNNLADVSREALKMKSRAIRGGFEGNYIYCKHCGSSIDDDSRFCKKCGKEQ